jgi:thiazole synthase ThiGH ThiG subunit
MQRSQIGLYSLDSHKLQFITSDRFDSHDRHSLPMVSGCTSCRNAISRFRMARLGATATWALLSANAPAYSRLH